MEDFKSQCSQIRHIKERASVEAYKRLPFVRGGEKYQMGADPENVFRALVRNRICIGSLLETLRAGKNRQVLKTKMQKMLLFEKEEITENGTRQKKSRLQNFKRRKQHLSE